MRQPLTATTRLTRPAARALRGRIVAQIRLERAYLREYTDQQVLNQYIEIESANYRREVSLYQMSLDTQRLLSQQPVEAFPVVPTLLMWALKIVNQSVPRHTIALTAQLLLLENRELHSELERLEEQDQERANLYASVPHHHPARSN